VRQGIVTTADLESSLEPDEKIAARLPDNPIGVVSLHDQQLLPLHPRVDRCEYIGRLAGNRARGAHAARSEYARDDAALFVRGNRACAFLGQCLSKVLRREPDFAPQLEKLLLGEFLSRFAGAALELGGAREHPLEAGAVERANGRFG
jgi:hypothetical protein